MKEASTLPSSNAVLLLLGGALLPCSLSYLLVSTNELRVFAALVAALGVSMIFARPFWGLILFVALVYSRPEESVAALHGMRLTLLISLITLFAMILQMMLSRGSIARSPLNPMLIGFAVMTMVSTLPTDQLSHTVEALQDILKLIILAFLVINLVRTPDNYRSLVTALLVFTAYLAFYSIRLYFTGGALQDHDGGRSQATGIFGDPNDLAATIVAGLALVLARIAAARKLLRILYIILGAVMIWAILLTNSRGGMLSLLVVFGSFFFAFQRRKGMAVFLALLFAGVFLAFGPSRMTKFDSEEESANSRLWFWDNGVDQVVSHPLTGVGYGNFPEVNSGMTAHNSFVLCFAELGIPGYFFWMGCIYYAFRRRRLPAVPAHLGLSSSVPQEGDLARIESHRKTTTEASPITQTDLFGSRLALAGFLTACFWLSRTYVPIMYLLFSLPMAAQNLIYPLGAPAEGAETPWAREWLRILGIVFLSIVLIKLMAIRLK